VLVRPDGLIAWRAPALPDNPLGALSEAMDKILGSQALRTAS